MIQIGNTEEMTLLTEGAVSKLGENPPNRVKHLRGQCCQIYVYTLSVTVHKYSGIYVNNLKAESGNLSTGKPSEKKSHRETCKEMLDFLYLFLKELFHLSFGLDIYEFSYMEGIRYVQSS